MRIATCHLFRGWYLDSKYTQAFTSITPTTNGDITLYAKWEDAHNYDMDNGKVIREATTASNGTIQYRCQNCTHTVTATIPKLTVENVPDSTLAVTDETILHNKDDGDIEGSSFAMIQARADKVTKKSVRLKWNKVEGADGYKIFGNKCGKKNRYEYIKTIKKNKQYTIKASEIKQSKKIKQHRKIAFESGDTKIATVTKKGVVKGKKKGNCYIYAYAQNGVYKKIKVKVK